METLRPPGFENETAPVEASIAPIPELEQAETDEELLTELQLGRKTDTETYNRLAGRMAADPAFTYKVVNTLQGNGKWPNVPALIGLQQRAMQMLRSDLERHRRAPAPASEYDDQNQYLAEGRADRLGL